MRRFNLRFTIALFTLVVGVSAATVWYVKRPAFSRTAEEENIVEVVFRHQICSDADRAPQLKASVGQLSGIENEDTICAYIGGA